MVLRCEECDALCDYGEGWIAHLVDDEEEPEQDAYVVVFCPRCAAREFGWCHVPNVTVPNALTARKPSRAPRAYSREAMS
jgi:hypothetical protein